MVYTWTWLCSWMSHGWLWCGQGSVAWAAMFRMAFPTVLPSVLAWADSQIPIETRKRSLLELYYYVGGKLTKSTRFQMMDFLMIPYYFQKMWSSHFVNFDIQISSCKLQQMCAIKWQFGLAWFDWLFLQTKCHHQPHHSQHFVILDHVQLRKNLRSAGESVTQKTVL